MSASNSATPPYDMEESALLAPYNYMAQAPGKHIRSKLAQAFNLWLNIDAAKLTQIASIIEMLHNASLMIDDIEDSSILRRGLPVTHSIYGVPRTINTANYAYFIALHKCMQLGQDKATLVFTETGGLFGLAVDLMQLFSANQENYRPLIDMLGLLFQIRDDYANLCSQEYADKKSYAEDLTEGKFSFPIIYAIRAHPDNDTKLINILRQKTTCVEVKRYCVRLLREAGAFDYTKKVLVDLDTAIMAELSRLGGNVGIAAVLEELRELYNPTMQ